MLNNVMTCIICICIYSLYIAYFAIYAYDPFTVFCCVGTGWLHIYLWEPFHLSRVNLKAQCLVNKSYWYLTLLYNWWLCASHIHLCVSIIYRCVLYHTGVHNPWYYCLFVICIQIMIYIYIYIYMCVCVCALLLVLLYSRYRYDIGWNACRKFGIYYISITCRVRQFVVKVNYRNYVYSRLHGVSCYPHVREGDLSCSRIDF